MDPCLSLYKTFFSFNLEVDGFFYPGVIGNSCLAVEGGGENCLLLDVLLLCGSSLGVLKLKIVLLPVYFTEKTIS